MPNLSGVGVRLGELVCSASFREAVRGLPFLFFFLGLAGQLVRLGVISAKELIVDSTLLRAWYRDDPDASWQKYAAKKALFGYKVHRVLCHQVDLPVFVLVTAAHVHDSQWVG